MSEPCPVVRMEQIVQAAKRAVSVSLTELRSNNRSSPIMNARHAVAIIAVRRTNQSIAGIGRYLNRNHTTILHAIGGLKRRVTNNDPLTNEYVVRIEAELDDILGKSPKVQTINPNLPSVMPTRRAIEPHKPAAHPDKMRKTPFIPMPDRPCITWVQK